MKKPERQAMKPERQAKRQARQAKRLARQEPQAANQEQKAERDKTIRYSYTQEQRPQTSCQARKAE